MYKTNISGDYKCTNVESEVDDIAFKYLHLSISSGIIFFL